MQVTQHHLLVQLHLPVRDAQHVQCLGTAASGFGQFEVSANHATGVAPPSAPIADPVPW